MCLLLLELPFQIIHEDRLCIRVRGPVNVKDKYFICLDKDSEVEKTDEDCTRSHKDVREEGRVYFTEIAREQAILNMNSIIQPLLENHI